MNHWLDWADKKRKEEEEKELVAFWNRMTVGLPLVPQQEDREDIYCYAQGLIFKNANIIRKHGLFVKSGLKILTEVGNKGPHYYRPPAGTVITKHRMKEID